ncbi:MAG: Crp/Fnr family transcriptional regulator [Saprospiraceae bacterium]|nr:Crp/Fnr family transcriptional regulator [Saprospiraceae bacterium]
MNLRSLLVFLRHLRIRSFKRGEIFIERGETKKNLFFIRKGMTRSYFINEKGDEITFQLFPEHYVMGNVHSLLFNEPSKFVYQALEDTKVYVIDNESFQNVILQNPRFLDLNRMDFNNMPLKQAFRRVESFVLLSPEERYLKYMNDYPSVINRAPDKYIANVLGITPVSLSRIKGRITAKRLR